MAKKTTWFLVSCMMVLSLLIASCGQESPSTPTTPTVATTPTASTSPTSPSTATSVAPANSDQPIYGGTHNLFQTTEPTSYHPSWVITGHVYSLQYQHPWEGDWTKGPAGGYGTNETDWGATGNDLLDLKESRIAESWEWTVDNANNEGALVYQIRQGIHYFENDWSEASKLVGGREVTADDVVYSIRQHLDDPKAFVHRVSAELQVAEVTKTGPWEVTIKVPVDTLFTAITRIGDCVAIYPPEVAEKYGDMNDPENAVGSGPFMIKDYVPNSQVTVVRNPNFWMTDPIGPGKGNQLPYINTVRVFTIPDVSTRQAAFRTAKIDFMNRFNREDAQAIRGQCPDLLESRAQSFEGRTNPTFLRTDMEPFNDIRVRKALMLATDFKGILQDIHGGEGQIVHIWADTPEYHELSLSYEDPDFPEEARELYDYNPEKAKALLAEAGYPNGFKTYINASNSGSTYVGMSEAEYYSIFASMWNQIGVELEIRVFEPGVLNSMRMGMEHSPVTTQQPGPVGVFHVGNPIKPGNYCNGSHIDDPVINDAMLEVRTACLTDMHEAMKICREKIYKHFVSQVYSLPSVQGYEYSFWWPWLRNFSGEWNIGYADQTVPMFIWIDQDLKQEMGY